MRNTTPCKLSPGHSRAGTSTVEFAVVAPLFFVILLGIVEFSWALCSTNVATNLAREAVHRAIMDDQTESGITKYSTELGESLFRISASKIEVVMSVTDRYGNAREDYDDAIQGDLIHVTVSVPYSEVSLIPGNWLGSSKIRGTATMMKI